MSTPENVVPLLPKAKQPKEGVNVTVIDWGHSAPRVSIRDERISIELSIETIERAALEVAKWKRQRRRLVHGGA